MSPATCWNRRLPGASADIEATGHPIAEPHPQASRKVVSDLMRRIDLLGEMPGMGTPRVEIRPDLRILPVGRYVVLYRQEGEDAVTIRVLHGARRWQNLLP